MDIMNKLLISLDDLGHDAKCLDLHAIDRDASGYTAYRQAHAPIGDRHKSTPISPLNSAITSTESSVYILKHFGDGFI
jgi:hypothetical protein